MSGSAIRAHHAAWIIWGNTIPIGHFVLHKCDNPKCVNPAHLFTGTALDNVHDMISKGRERYVKVDCEHTPSEKWYMSSLDVYLPFRTYWDVAPKERAQHYELITDWEPNQRGRPMTLEEAYRDLQIVLLAYPQEFCFSVQFHHRLGMDYRYPDVAKVERWLAEQFARADERRKLERIAA